MIAEAFMNNVGDNKQSLVLHACCAPCATTALKRLTADYNVTVFFSNDNIDTKDEYQRRAAELYKLTRLFEIKEIVVPEYADGDFYSAARGFETDREGGERCGKCFYMRLKKTADEALRRGADLFATTLTVSPHKNAALINSVGAEIAKSVGIAYLESDFKKADGFRQSIEYSRELDLYRQNYCGCRFTKQR